MFQLMHDIMILLLSIENFMTEFEISFCTKRFLFFLVVSVPI